MKCLTIEKVTRADDTLLTTAVSEAHTTAVTQREVIATLQGRVERLRTLLQSELDQGTWAHRPMTRMAIEAVMRETGTTQHPVPSVDARTQDG